MKRGLISVYGSSYFKKGAGEKEPQSGRLALMHSQQDFSKGSARSGKLIMNRKMKIRK